MGVAQPTTERTIIRFSQAWWAYMFLGGGILRGLVNGLEDTLAITGRTLLLVFLLYCGVKSGALYVNPSWKPDIWLEMGMFVVQLAGLEGSIPGLARHAEELTDRGDHERAKKVQGVMTSARVMTVLTIGEGVLHVFGLDPGFLQIVSGILLFVRGITITGFLVVLARIEAKGPRILSRAEYAGEKTSRDDLIVQDRLGEIVEQFSGQLVTVQNSVQMVQSSVQTQMQQAVQTVQVHLENRLVGDENRLVGDRLLDDQNRLVIQEIVYQTVQGILSDHTEIVQANVQQIVYQGLEEGLRRLHERQQTEMQKLLRQFQPLVEVREVKEAKLLQPPSSNGEKASSDADLGKRERALAYIQSIYEQTGKFPPHPQVERVVTISHGSAVQYRQEFLKSIGRTE